MLARIAAYTEAHRPANRLDSIRAIVNEHPVMTVAEGMASVVEHALETVPCVAVFVRTRTGTTARMISRFHHSSWIVPLSSDDAVCQGLVFSYGVHADPLAEDPENWREFARDWLLHHGLPGKIVMLVAGPSPQNPDSNHRVEFMRVDGKQMGQ
jgi:pyruvate kinase